MEQGNVDQAATDRAPQVGQPEPTASPPVNQFSSKKLLVILGIVAGFIFFGVGGYYLGTLQSNKSEGVKLTDTKIEPTKIPSSTPLSFHYLSSNSKIYESPRLGITFEYPRGIVKVYDCPDIPCISIDEYTIRVEPLRIYGVEEIKSDDLYCSADGPTGSTYCLNPEVESFTNANGVGGYKVLRTLVIETYNPATQTRDKEEYDDKAYVFPITHSEYKAVLFAVDTPSSENLEHLDTIVETLETTI